MKKLYFIFAGPLLCAGLGLAVIHGLAAGVEQDAASKLLGDWIVTSKYGTSGGEAVFREDMSYTLTEHHPDGTAVTHKGEYKLDLSTEPWAIDLCVGKFSNPGSEWVTTVGILRFLSDDEAEIHFDPGGKRPQSFDAVTDQNTHRMKRK
ncbi:MAG: hypothetical protein SCM96_10900 [Acidobacteriota bacterium]|nr:hypothetical protein [Acidobacteriota bacterium]